MSDSALYVYAIVPAPVPRDALEELAGIDASPVRAIECAGGVAALVHAGDPVPYQGPEEDVQRWILEHSRVVEGAWEAFGTVLPVTFNVIVKGDATTSAEARLQAWLAESTDALRQRLHTLARRVELRVEIGFERSEAARNEAEAQALRGEMATKPPGLRRLLERRLEQVEKEAVERRADRLYPEFRRRIASHADELVENRRARPVPGVVPVLSVALLARREAVEALGAELARIETEHPAARIRFLGPWPPYSFGEVPAAMGNLA